MLDRFEKRFFFFSNPLMSDKDEVLITHIEAQSVEEAIAIFNDKLQRNDPVITPKLVRIFDTLPTAVTLQKLNIRIVEVANTHEGIFTVAEGLKLRDR